MIITATLSYPRLLELFGEGNFVCENVMEYLLYRISPREFYPTASANNLTSLDSIGCSETFSTKNYSLAKDRLPNYLGKTYSVENMNAIEAKLYRLELALREYRQTPRASFWKKFKAWLKYNTLRRERTSVQNAFNYLEYRETASGLEIVAFRQKFMAFAKDFSKPQKTFWG